MQVQHPEVGPGRVLPREIPNEFFPQTNIPPSTGTTFFHESSKPSPGNGYVGYLWHRFLMWLVVLAAART